MQFTVQKNDLLRELALVQGVVEKKVTIPILSNLLLRATKEGVEIVATDMELGIQSSCEADVTTPGAVTLHARRLHDIVRALPDSEISFSLQKGNRVQIRCARSDFKIAGQGTEEYPTLREYDFKNAIALPLEDLRGMIERVIFAITMDDPRYAIYGALVIVRKGRIEMIATDGHRMACVRRDSEVAPREEIRAIVPRKTLSEIIKLEAGPEGEVRMGVKDSHIFVRSGVRTLQSSLFEGSFPNWEKVIPASNDKFAVCDRSGLLAALQRVSLLSAERTKAVKMTIAPDRMVVSTSNPEFGEAEESIEIERYEGDPLEIGFNARYLMDFLAAVGTERIVLEVKDGETQGLLRPEIADGLDYRYVVMPMRI